MKVKTTLKVVIYGRDDCRFVARCDWLCDLEVERVVCVNKKLRAMRDGNVLTKQVDDTGRRRFGYVQVFLLLQSSNVMELKKKASNGNKTGRLFASRDH